MSDGIVLPNKFAAGRNISTKSRVVLSYGHYKGENDSFFAVSKGAGMAADKSEVLQGTLDLMILKTLQALGPLHGFGIARRIEQLSEDVLTALDTGFLEHLPQQVGDGLRHVTPPI
jgi:hypothetical protein